MPKFEVKLTIDIDVSGLHQDEVLEAAMSAEKNLVWDIAEQVGCGKSSVSIEETEARELKP